LEDWLVWAALLAAEGAVLEAAQWCEATIQNPARAWNTARKAKRLQEECERRLDPEERDMARRCAISADLDAWNGSHPRERTARERVVAEALEEPGEKEAKAKPPQETRVQEEEKIATSDFGEHLNRLLSAESSRADQAQRIYLNTEPPSPLIP
jgi:hypothetical protein